MNIGLIALHYGNLTGSETYLYTLAGTLRKRGHQVSISCLSSGGPLIALTNSLGVKVQKIDEIVDKPDIYHMQHTPAVAALLEIDPYTPKVMTIHSEVIPQYESAVIHDSIKRYIGVRPMIVTQLKKQGIKADLIYNGIDTDVFKKTPIPEGDPIILFAGTKDYLRQTAAVDLLGEIRKRNAKIIFCGRGWESCIDATHPSVLFLPQTPHIEKVIAEASEVAGVQMGRWELEGWFMGRPSIEYIVDNTGQIIKKTLRKPLRDLTRYTADYMTDKLEEVYKSIL